ncbi:MAG: hypothetical protein KBT32_11560 [Bacteroidales bacterium]|nr:hypothetical protein [Candidatus Physcocola equi]
MSDLCDSLECFEDIICDSLSDWDNWKIVDSEYDDEPENDGCYWGYVKVRFYNMDRDEIEDCLDSSMGGYFEDDWDWNWSGRNTVKISKVIWDENEDGEPDEDD